MDPEEPPKDCGVVDFVCKAGQAAEEGLQGLATDFIEAAGDAIVSLSTFWMNSPPPRVGDFYETGGFQPAPTISFLTGSLSWLTMAIAVLAVLIGAGRIAWTQRMQAGRDLLAGLLQLILISGAGLAFIALMLAFSTALAFWIIERATDNFGESLGELFALDDLDQAWPLLVILAVLALLSSLGQMGLMVVRSAVLPLLAGSWATSAAAAATRTEVGRAAFARHTSWLLAYLLYMPTAATIYAFGFITLEGAPASGDPVGQAISGFAVVTLAILALPALMKLLAPVGAMVGGSGGGGGGAIAAAAVAGPAGAAIMRTPAAGAAAAGGASSGGGGGSTSGGGGGRRGGGPSGSGPTTGGSRRPGGGAPPPGPGGTKYMSPARSAGIQAAIAASQAASGAVTPDDDSGDTRGK